MTENQPEKTPITYQSSGVDYSQIDPVKRLAQEKAKETAGNLSRFGFAEVESSRGESAYVWEEQDRYGAFVIEGLGTKNLVADEVRKFTKKTHYDTIAQDTVAMIVNDLIVVGAEPQVVDAYWAVGDPKWLRDEKRTNDLITGWAKACDMAGAVWGGGETPTLKDIINPETIDLAGSAVGSVKPKERLTLGEKIIPGDIIFAVESSGIHANGLTLARQIAKNLPEGYATLLPDGKTYGESLLSPTHIYANLVRDLFGAGVDIHYMVNVTGHGWRKLMRAKRNLSYLLDKTPKPQAVFDFIKEQAGLDDYEMYGNYNMGVGFVIFMPREDILKASRVSAKNKLWAAPIGQVEEGPKQVIIKPKDIIFTSDTLDLRQ